ncbi:MAG TPA: thioredoxin domain-containing protein [Longimicrobiales bacterium]
MSHCLSANVRSGILLVCAIAVTALALRKATNPATRQTRPEPAFITHWRDLAAEGLRRGPISAPVVMIEFGNYQCPFCAAIEPEIRTLRQRYPSELAVVYRHFVLESVHPQGFRAALAAECAAAQGTFETMHRTLYERQHQIGTLPWDVFARLAGVPDLEAFRVCMREEPFRHRVERDTEAARRAGLGRTPTLLVNGRVFVGASSIGRLSATLAALAAEHD